MGANKTYQQTGNRGRMLGESADFRRLRHAVEKSAGDRERAIRNVCRQPAPSCAGGCELRSKVCARAKPSDLPPARRIANYNISPLAHVYCDGCGNSKLSRSR